MIKPKKTTIRDVQSSLILRKSVYGCFLMNWVAENCRQTSCFRKGYNSNINLCVLVYQYCFIYEKAIRNYLLLYLRLKLLL